MNTPNRYHLWAALECHAFSKAEAVLRFSAEEDGMWVQWQDYARLKAEVERLTAEVSYDNRVQLHVDKLAAEFTQSEVERLKAEVERLTAELSSTTAWGRGLESDLSHARVEISFLKAEVERLSAADSYLQSANEYSFEQRCDELEAEVERLRKAGDAMRWLIECQNDDAYYGHNEEHAEAVKAWNAAKEGKPQS